MSGSWLRSLGASVLPGLARRIVAEAGLHASSDEGFDLSHYEHVTGRRFRSRDAAALHYLRIGTRRDLQPQVGFSPDRYRKRNPDVAAAGYEPFAHYLNFGRREGRALEARDQRVSPAMPDIQRMLTYAPTTGGHVDVIVPIYGSRALALNAIDGVLSTRTPCELVVVDDASPDPVLSAELRMLAERGLITLLVNETNLGFVASVNRGMSLHGDRDIVLLNSDTHVFGDWLDRLLVALRSTPETATATPMSNAATILSYPLTLQENAVGLADGRIWDALIANTAANVVEVPTGIGFCMAIRRDCLDEIGLFDAANFGRGYGEENDFCLRATAGGWRHVAATNVFVWHRGGGSFAAERDERLPAALATLERLHPGYGETIRRFIARDPLRAARTALDIARIAADPRPKRLALDASHQVDRASKVLTISLLPDIAPFHGQFVFVTAGLPGIASLPRIDSRITPEAAMALMKALSVIEISFGSPSHVPPVLHRSFRLAAEQANIATGS